MTYSLFVITDSEHHSIRTSGHEDRPGAAPQELTVSRQSASHPSGSPAGELERVERHLQLCHSCRSERVQLPHRHLPQRHVTVMSSFNLGLCCFQERKTAKNRWRKGWKHTHCLCVSSSCSWSLPVSFSSGKISMTSLLLFSKSVNSDVMFECFCSFASQNIYLHVAEHPAPQTHAGADLQAKQSESFLL